MRQAEPPPVSAADQPKRAGFLRRCGEWLFSQRHFHFKLLSGTAAGVTVIVLLAGIFLYVTIRNHQQENLRAYTIDVLRVSSLIENDIAALETGHRGFLLTGKSDYTLSFDRRRETIKRRIENLNALIFDNPKQRKRVVKVQTIVQQWLDTVAVPEIKARQATSGASGET